MIGDRRHFRGPTKKSIVSTATKTIKLIDYQISRFRTLIFQFPIPNVQNNPDNMILIYVDV